MPHLTLVVGSKRYSSWSLRPWLALKQSGLPFQEVVIRLRQTDTKAGILQYSPAGKVPVLMVNNQPVWDSLAVCETIAELAPSAGLWPDDRQARALARSISAEMHAGFMPLRQAMPMEVTKLIPMAGIPQDVRADIARITALWNDCRRHCGQDGGPFLFGRFTIADAMYAPLATRFNTYGVALDDVSAAYVQALLALPAMREWKAAAMLEPESAPL